DPRARGLAAQLGQPAALRGGGTGQVQVSHGLPRPQPERTPEIAAGRGRVAGGPRVQAGHGQLLENVGVQLTFGNPQHVTGPRPGGGPPAPRAGADGARRACAAPRWGGAPAPRRGRAPPPPTPAPPPPPLRRCDWRAAAAPPEPRAAAAR